MSDSTRPAMTTATIYRIYTVNLDSPLWPDDLPMCNRLAAWLEIARTDPELAFACMVQDDVDGKIDEEVEA